METRTINKPSNRKGLKAIEIYGPEKASLISRKISNARKGKPSHRKGITALQEYGIEKAILIGNKISKSKIGKTYEDLYGDKSEEKRLKKVQQGLYNNPFKGKHFSDESRKKLSKSIKAKYDSGFINPNLGNKYNQERLKRMSEMTSKRWQNPEFRDKCVKATMAALKLRPTKPEKILTSELGLFWRYVGDGQLIIGSKCPDFWNGDHKIIELFGDFWHRDHNPQDWVDYYAKWGYKCLVIWEHELKNIKKVREKIKQFEIK